MTNYPVGIHVFKVPIRYWETQQPEEYEIFQEYTAIDKDKWVHAKNLVDGWIGYLRQEDIYFEKNNAIQAVYLKWMLDKLRGEDEIALMMFKMKSDLLD